MTSANPYCRSQRCSQYADDALVSLRLAELIANLSLHGVPGSRAVRRRLCDHSCKRHNSRRILFRIEIHRPWQHGLPGEGNEPIAASIPAGTYEYVILVTVD
jgi:hypothetical protein